MENVSRERIDGQWAIYKGKVYVRKGANVHEEWFPKVGIPASGEAFDKVTRGFIQGDDLVWWENSGKESEFLKYSAKLNKQAGTSNVIGKAESGQETLLIL